MDKPLNLLTFSRLVPSLRDIRRGRLAFIPLGRLMLSTKSEGAKTTTIKWEKRVSTREKMGARTRRRKSVESARRTKTRTSRRWRWFNKKLLRKPIILQPPLERSKKSCPKPICMPIVTRVRTRESPTTRLEATTQYTLEKPLLDAMSSSKSSDGATFQQCGLRGTTCTTLTWH